MITIEELKEWAATIVPGSKVGIENDLLVAQHSDDEGWEETLEVGELPTVDDQ